MISEQNHGIRGSVLTTLAARAIPLLLGTASIADGVFGLALLWNFDIKYENLSSPAFYIECSILYVIFNTQMCIGALGFFLSRHDPHVTGRLASALSLAGVLLGGIITMIA